MNLEEQKHNADFEKELEDILDGTAIDKSLGRMVGGASLWFVFVLIPTMNLLLGKPDNTDSLVTCLMMVGWAISMISLWKEIKFYNAIK